MPLVGMDWSHTGVAHLFSAIKVHLLSPCIIIIENNFVPFLTCDVCIMNMTSMY